MSVGSLTKSCNLYYLPPAKTLITAIISHGCCCSKLVLKNYVSPNLFGPPVLTQHSIIVVSFVVLD